MSTTLDAAKGELLAAFIEYVDWDNAASEPYDVTLGTKKEGDTGDLVAVPAITFPAVTVEVGNPEPTREYGTQTELRFIVQVSIIYKFDAAEEPNAALEDITGKVIWNIMESKHLEDQWIGLDWVSKITYAQGDAYPPLRRFLNTRATDQDADGSGFVASQTNFSVFTYEVQV